MVSTVRKSQASMLPACARRKACPDECVRCGAGWRPASSSTLRTEVAETAIPRPLSSPTIRLYPQCGFSRARRRISSRSERSSPGRPGLRCEYVHRRAISWRCQRSSVSGLNKKAPGRPGKRAAQRRQQRAICSCQLRPRGLAAEDRQLMAEDEDLQLLGTTRTPQQPHQREQAPDNEIYERPEQAASLDDGKSAEPSEQGAATSFEPYAARSTFSSHTRRSRLRKNHDRVVDTHDRRPDWRRRVFSTPITVGQVG